MRKANEELRPLCWPHQNLHGPDLRKGSDAAGDEDEPGRCQQQGLYPVLRIPRVYW